MKHPLISFWIVLWLAGVSPAGADPSPTAPAGQPYEKLRDRARAAWEKQDFKLARTNYLAAHAALLQQGFKHPRFADSLAELAAFHCARGEPYLSGPYVTQLRDHFAGAGRTNSLAAAYASYLFGRVQLQLYKFERAEAALQRALAIVERKHGAKSLAVAHLKARLGQLHVWTGQDEKAVALLSDGLRVMAKADLGKPRDGLRLSRESMLRPDIQDLAELKLEHTLALVALGRKREGQASLQQAEQLLAKVVPSARFHVLAQAAQTLEARGDLRAAEAHVFAAAEVLWQDDKLSRREKLRGNELVLEFLVRQGQDGKAATQEGLLFEAGIPQNYLDELNLRCEALSYAREGGPHKKRY